MNDADSERQRLAALEAEVQQLRRENQAWRSAHLAGPVAQLDIDPDGRVLMATARAAQLLHFASGVALVGKTLSEAFPDGQCAQIRECMAHFDSEASGERRCMIRGHRQRGRSTIWLRVNLTRAVEQLGFTLVLTDVTDLERNRRELAADADLFGALLQVAGVEFFEWHSGRLFRSSPGFAQLVGIGPAGSMPNSVEEWSKRIHPDDQTRMQERWRAPHGTHLAPVEYRIYRDDGRLCWLRSASIVRRDENGEISGMSGVVRDVSAEHEARSNLLRLQTLVDTARAAILMLNAEGRVVLANRAFCDAVGTPHEQLIGSSMDQYCFPEDIEQRRISVRGLLVTGAASFSWRMRCADGGERWYQVDGSTYGEEVVDRRQFVFIGTDSEASRRERLIMIERERWLDHILRDAGIGAFRLDRCRNEGETVGAYAELYQLSQPKVLMPEELIAMVPREHRARVSAQLHHFLASQTRATMDFPVELNDGLRWLRAFLRNEGPFAEHKGVLSSVVFDISLDRQRAAESEELQARIYHAQKTESLGVMAGGIAHDLNNMLMAAIGQLNLAVSAVPKESSLGRYLGTVESVLGRMEGLTERMLAYAGKSSERRQPVDLTALLQTMEPLLRASCGHHARLRLDLPAQPLVVLGDATQIEQVVLNFVQNAVDAIGERGGNVRLRLATLRDEELRTDALQWPINRVERYAELVVRDDGPGITESDVRRVFEPFYTTKTTGRGLGLSVVQGIVKAHNGSIKVLSEIGIGSEFRVFLPLLSDFMLPSEASEAQPPPLHTHALRPVLAIDDDEDVLAITVVMLEQCGLEVAAFLSGDEAIAELTKWPERYAGAIVDLTMPVKDGVAVVRELREIVPDLPILFVSGYSKEQASELVATDESTQFLRKPFRVDGLTRALEQLLRPL